MVLSYKGKVIVDGERKEITDDMFQLMKMSEKKKQDFISVMALDGNAMISKDAPSAVLGLAAVVYAFISEHGSHNFSLALTMGEEIAWQGELQLDTMMEYENLVNTSGKESD